MQQQQIPSFKCTLKHKDRTETHRFSGNFDWDGLNVVLQHLWGGNVPKAHFVEYIDDENDTIKINSDIEWRECLRLQTNYPIRLSVRKAKKDEVKQQAVPLVEETTASAPAAAPEVNEPTPLEQEAVSADDACASPVIDLLSILFNCDATKELSDKNSTVDFKGVVRVVHSSDLEADVDINEEQLYKYTVKNANDALDNGQFGAAVRVLQAASQFFTTKSKLFYTLACAYSLCQKADEGIVALRRAIELGFSDTYAVKHDTDIGLLRNHPLFLQTLALMKEGEQQQEEVVQAAPQPEDDYVIEEAPEPPLEEEEESDIIIVDPGHEEEDEEPIAEPIAVPVIPVVPRDPNVEMILSIFPDMTEEGAKALLARADNNVRRAVDMLFC